MDLEHELGPGLVCRRWPQAEQTLSKVAMSWHPAQNHGSHDEASSEFLLGHICQGEGL